MATSRRWKELNREINSLRVLFLPNAFDPLGSYSDFNRVQAYTRAFIVLSHAEIETYLEGWAKDITSACEGVWKSYSRITKPFAFLLATIAERIEIANSLAEAKGKDIPTRLSDESTRLFQRHYKQIKDNHGIKEKNFWTLFAPLGVPSGALGSTLLPNLDSFGDLRGKHAHQSVRAVRSVLDPETEYKRVVDLTQELRQFDEWLARYRKTVR